MTNPEIVETRGPIGQEIKQLVTEDMYRVMRKAARLEHLPNFMRLAKPGQEITSNGETYPVPKGMVWVKFGFAGITDFSGFDRRVNTMLAKRGQKTTPLTR